jgi:serine O-acetyltransferase
VTLVALSLGELALIYLIPVAAFVALWLGVSLILYLLVRSRLDFDFKQDLLRKFDEKRGLPSGVGRLSLLYVAKVLLGDNCIQAAFLYRIARYFASHRLRTFAEIVYAFSRFATHTDLSPWANIAPGLYLYHGLGTVVGKGSTVGKRALICHGVSIGGGATLGDDVKVWAGAQIVAGVTIGDRTEVGTNAVVMTDFPSDSILFGIPARLAGRREGPQSEVESPAPSE